MGQALPPARDMPRPQAGRHKQTRPPAPASSPGDNGNESVVPSRDARLPSPHHPITLSPRHSVTLEALLYAVILAAAILTRFWDLGSRALHHDESLHAYFSWLLATGQNYSHDPLMHGPFLFHMNALIYAIVGDSDASSRYSAALFGVILVALPILLRSERHLGRWGALTASTLVLISPAILYQSRYIRHDIFTLVGSLLLFIAIVRYVERPSRGWLIGMGATLGFLVTNHEIVFGVAAIFLGVIGGALLWGPWRRLIPFMALSGAAAIALTLVLPERTRPLPSIPWSSPSQSQQFAFYGDLLTHPLILALALLAVVTVAAAVLLMRTRRDPERCEEGWAPALFGDPPPGSVAAAARAVWLDRPGLSWSLIAGLAIFALLFTTLFTNLYGLASGTIATDGTLLYWMGQHDVQRGEQPWFYYLLLMPQYEFIAVLFGTAASLIVAVRALLVGIGKATPGPRFFFQIFLAIWFGGILAALSWAGEKMPWLVTHITLPATLLAAALLGQLWERWRPLALRSWTEIPGAFFPTAAAVGATPASASPAARETAPRLPHRATTSLDASRTSPGSIRMAPQGILFVALLGLAACWFLLAATMTYGQFVPASIGGGWERVPAPWALERWWLLAVPPLAALLAIVVTGIRRGARAAAQPALAAVVLLLALAQVHVAWRLVYQEGDVPKDMLVYTQTSPDLHRMTSELTALSALTTGGRDLEIWFDDNDGTAWPMQWYLRNFPNRQLYGGTQAGPPDEVPIVLAADKNLSSVEPYLEGYTAQKYVLRWWFPEDPIYRDFAIAPELPPGRSAWKSSDDPHGPREIAASIAESLSHLLTPEGQQGLYRLVMYRDLPVKIESYNYTLFIRNDLLPLYNEIRY